MDRTLTANRSDQITFVRRLIDTAVPAIKARGKFTPGTAAMPPHWEATFGPLTMMVTSNLLSLSTDTELSDMLDIWPSSGGKKLASVVWMPSKPYMPPVVITLRRTHLEPHFSWLAGA